MDDHGNLEIIAKWDIQADEEITISLSTCNWCCDSQHEHLQGAGQATYQECNNIPSM